MKTFLSALIVLPWLASAADSNWSTYVGDKASSHYSTLKQLTPRNVAKLEVAWIYHAGGMDTNNRSQIQCNPLGIDGVLYGTTPDLQLFALEASSGRELWRFDPASVKGITKAGVNRGLVHWGSGTERRILYGNDHFLHAIDAATGHPIPSFGEGGSIDLKRDLGRDVSGLALQSTTPGVLFGELLIMGMRLGEGPAPAAPGHIADRCRRPSHQIRPCFCLQSRNRRATVPDSRSAGADVRSGGRIRLAHAAAPDQARAVLPAALHL